VAAKNSPRFCCFNFVFVSGAQTPLPLIHPAGSVFGGLRGGEGQNQDGDGGTIVVTIWVSQTQNIALRLLLMCHSG